MQKALLVGLGGSLGSTLRYLLVGLVLRIKPGAGFPFETLVVNVLGCLAIGFLAALSESRGILTGEARAFVFIGVLGGFTIPPPANAVSALARLRDRLGAALAQ